MMSKKMINIKKKRRRREGVVVAKQNTFSQYKEEIPTLISR